MTKKKRNKKAIYIPTLLGLFVIGSLLFIKFRNRIYSPDLNIKELKQTNLICGIDISKYQPHIDWDKVAQQIDFVFIRASSGSRYCDPMFEKHYNNAVDHEIPIGAYHYFVFNVDGKKQAENFLKNIGNNYFELPLVIDVEEHPKYGRSNFNYKTTINNLRDFINTVENKTGNTIMIYTNTECYEKYIQPNFPNHRLWICSFQSKEKLPVHWTFWQKTHTGEIEGIKGYVDINIFNGNRKTWYEYIGKIM